MLQYFNIPTTTSGLSGLISDIATTTKTLFLLSDETLYGFFKMLIVLFFGIVALTYVLNVAKKH